MHHFAQCCRATCPAYPTPSVARKRDFNVVALLASLATRPPLTPGRGPRPSTRPAAGDVRRVRHFSRHAKIEILLHYDDNRRDEAGAIARLLGEDS